MADISRADALGLLATQELGDIIQGARKESAALNTFRTIRMSKGTARMPVLEALPTAGWVTESATEAGGVKPTSEVKWGKKELIAEELAVIVPVHENVLDDTDYDLWGEVRPLVEEQFGILLDSAVFFGVNKPATWTDPALVPGAIAAGNTYAETAGEDLAEALNQTFALVEEDGFDVNAAYTGRFLRARLRGLRDTNGQPIYLDNVRADDNTRSIYGENLTFVDNGAWNRATATALVGDADNAILGIRQDVQVKLLTEATVGGINLAERDMIGLRFKFRVAYALANPLQAGSPEDAFPFAALTPIVEG